MVGCHVAPSVQFAQFSHPGGIGRVGAGQVEDEPETPEILSKVLEVRVSMVNRPMGCELGLDEKPE